MKEKIKKAKELRISAFVCMNFPKLQKMYYKCYISYVIYCILLFRKTFVVKFKYKYTESFLHRFYSDFCFYSKNYFKKFYFFLYLAIINIDSVIMWDNYLQACETLRNPVFHKKNKYVNVDALEWFLDLNGFKFKHEIYADSYRSFYIIAK